MSKENRLSRVPLILQASLCCFLWATAIPTLKISYKLLNISSSEIYNRLVLAGLRFLLAGFLIGVYFVIKEKKIPYIEKKLWKTILIFGLLNTTLQYLFFYVGVANTPAIKGVVIDSIKPLMVVVLAHFLIKDDRLSLNKILGLTLGILGMVVANISDFSNGGLNFEMSFIGEGFLIIASLAYSIAVIYGRNAMKQLSSVLLNMFQLIIGALILLIVGLIGAKGFHLNFNIQSISLLIYSSFLSAIAFVVWYQLIFKYGASSVSVFVFLIPVFGSIISSVLFIDEHITLNVLISLVIMSLSIYLVNKQKNKKTLN